MSITTKTGDNGDTRLFSGELVSKYDSRVDVCGTIDEVNSHLGVVKTIIKDEQIKRIILEIQNDLFTIGSIASNYPYVSFPENKADHITNLCEEWEAKIPPITSFIIPGGTYESAQIDVARAVSRRLERSVVFIMTSNHIPYNRSIIVWLNRLSDLLWIFARYVENGKTDLRG